MTSPRLYRDYTSEEESSNGARSRPVSSSKAKPRISIPREMVTAPDDKEQKVLNDAVEKLRLEQANDEDGVSSRESDLNDPDFDEQSIPSQWNDSAKALPVLLSNAQRERDPVRSPPPTPPSRKPDQFPDRGINRTPRLSSPTTTSKGESRFDGVPATFRPMTSSPENMPQFFSRTVFHTVLHSPTITHQLLKFGQSRLCGESIEFLLRINRYHALLQEVNKSISDIHAEFLAEGAPSQINIPQSVLIKVNSDVKNSLSSAMPKLESIFGAAQSDVEQLIYGDVYPSFVRHQLSRTAAFALGGAARAKFGGLGDCFVLTDPSKADNPIMFASDGFVKVTGYPRKEIIPRNCRFLQSPHTDRVVVRRLKAAIENREESVELLLNQRKTGEPFWNLLYTTPLLDSNGKVVFFLGGQINCSTTIHSTSDVLRVLAQEDDARPPVEAHDSAQLRKKPSRKGGLFRSSESRTEKQEGRPGMEDGLLDRLESLPLPSQLRSFYGAYSNFIIVNYSTLLIAFLSPGIVEMLFPIKARSTNDAAAAGMDIFRFLANHSSGSLGWDYKSAVKGALKTGQAISLDLKLCAKPSMGFQKFMCHWTPLKDERGMVVWVVLTLGSKQGR